MKQIPCLILVLLAGTAQAGPRLGAASYGQAGGTSGYGQTATMGSYGSGQTQGYSAGGVNADLGKRYSAAGARSRSKGDTATSDSETSYSQPSLYQSSAGSTLQQPKTQK